MKYENIWRNSLTSSRNTNFSVEDLKKTLKNHEKYNLSSLDKKITRGLYKQIEKTNKFPDWWTLHNSSYLENCKDSEKTVRYVAFRYKFDLLTSKRITLDFPLYVLIEPTSVCNLRCPMCFQCDKTFTQKPYMGFMDINLFYRVIDECSENGTEAITLASRGEPTLHPKFCEMLHYAKGKFLELKINTNGTRLTEKICHAIFESEVTDMVLSIDSDNEETFEKIRYKAKFSKVLENVKMINNIRDKHYPDSKTVIRISGIDCLPEQKLENFYEFWGGLADEITKQPAEERWDTYSNSLHPELTKPCGYPWQRFYVWYDGTCNPCDVDYKSKLSPGKLSESMTIKSIWKSDKLKQLKKLHKDGKRSLVSPCDRCGVE